VAAAGLAIACALAVVLLHGGGDAGTVVRTDGGAAAAASHPVVLHDLAGYGAGQTPLPDGATYVVRPGDTLWSIAAAVDPSRDVREVVDHLAALNGGPILRAGQVIRLR
jgi:Tfp pilus assembly protein FimV